MRRLVIAMAIAGSAILAASADRAAAQPSPDATAPAPEPPTADPDAPGVPPPASAPTVTRAPADATPAAAGASDEIGDQAISVELGAAAGGRVTPGGLRIAGQFLYQLNEEDWFDGGASFTFGSGRASCFRDRSDKVICTHGVADGIGVELSASIRRMFAPRGPFHPFARVGVGLGLVRFGDDDVSGFTIPAHGGAGVRVAVAPSIAVVAEADLALGFGSFSRGLGSQPQLGLAIAAGVEFRLR
jgi:opacity protein-like surface antigen